MADPRGAQAPAVLLNRDLHRTYGGFLPSSDALYTSRCPSPTPPSPPSASSNSPSRSQSSTMAPSALPLFSNVSSASLVSGVPTAGMAPSSSENLPPPSRSRFRGSQSTRLSPCTSAMSLAANDLQSVSHLSADGPAPTLTLRTALEPPPFALGCTPARRRPPLDSLVTTISTGFLAAPPHYSPRNLKKPHSSLSFGALGAGFDAQSIASVNLPSTPPFQSGESVTGSTLAARPCGTLDAPSDPFSPSADTHEYGPGYAYALPRTTPHALLTGAADVELLAEDTLVVPAIVVSQSELVLLSYPSPSTAGYIFASEAQMAQTAVTARRYRIAVDRV
ncbi:hypothetical protein EIP86_002996 [Pleurotus ostreatoroseus]|nr:hypothetical protein EIP86_002996 [Pleurotus ostreatoroseus]